MSAHIEFVRGIAKYNNQLIVSFGYQDNGAYILTIPQNIINQIINVLTFVNKTLIVIASFFFLGSFKEVKTLNNK